MNEKELMEQLKAGILRDKVKAKERAEREEAERLEVAKAREKWDRIQRRIHQEAKHLEPLVSQLLKGWHPYGYKAQYICEVFKLDMSYVRNSDMGLPYHVSRVLIEWEEPNPLTKLKEVMDGIDEQITVKFIDDDIEVVDAKQMLKECEEELEDDKPSLTLWWYLVGILFLWWYFTK